MNGRCKVAALPKQRREIMNTLLEAIQAYPERFMDTLSRRADTTPNPINFENHLKLMAAIEEQDWVEVVRVSSLPEYQKPLQGVVLCLNRSGFDYNTVFTIEVHRKLMTLVGY